MNIGKCLIVSAFAAALATAAGPQPVTVGQKNRTFSTSEVTVAVGEPVTFVNDDVVVHNVFSASPGHEFNLKTQKPGAKADIAFDKEGTVEVRCAIHPTMKLRIHVTPRRAKNN